MRGRCVRPGPAQPPRRPGRPAPAARRRLAGQHLERRRSARRRGHAARPRSTAGSVAAKPTRPRRARPDAGVRGDLPDDLLQRPLRPRPGDLRGAEGGVEHHIRVPDEPVVVVRLLDGAAGDPFHRRRRVQHTLGSPRAHARPPLPRSRAATVPLRRGSVTYFGPSGSWCALRAAAAAAAAASPIATSGRPEANPARAAPPAAPPFMIELTQAWVSVPLSRRRRAGCRAEQRGQGGPNARPTARPRPAAAGTARPRSARARQVYPASSGRSR